MMLLGVWVGLNIGILGTLYVLNRMYNDPGTYREVPVTTSVSWA